jgi:FkbM family methyltransferase
MTPQRFVKWFGEVPVLVSLLPVWGGLLPFCAVRFGYRSHGRIRIRGAGRLTLVNRLSAMVFVNIWVRREYPQPGKHDVVLDLGANVGLFSTFALWHGAKFCHCVEPCPTSVRHLEAHLTEFGFADRTNIIAKAVGAAERSGFIPFTSNVNNFVTEERAPGLVPVEIADIANVFDELKPVPTYVKLDIEGDEVPVLQKLLSSSAINSVHTIAVESMEFADTIASLLARSGFIVRTYSRPATIVVGIRAANQ